MTLVVFLKGINVGGRRRFRPSLLARDLAHLRVVSVGAAGTFVVRCRVPRAELRAEVSRQIPFEADMMVCGGRDVLDLVARDPFAGRMPSRREIVHFVSVMPKRPRKDLPVPATLPVKGRWGLRVLGRQGPFVFGLHRREMKAIGYLAELEKLLGVPLATRSWGTIESIARLL